MTVQANTRNMKTTVAIAFLLLPVAFPTASPKSSAPYEIVLEGAQVVFYKAETTPSEVIVQFTVRNLGAKTLIAPDLSQVLSVVWDGKEYERARFFWNSPFREIPPKTFWRTELSLSDYLVPAAALTVGSHTIALKDALAESKTVTVFIEKTSADQAVRQAHEKAGSAARLPNAPAFGPLVEQAPASVADDAAWGEQVEGVSVRLRADKIRWASNETPTLNLDVRNQGRQEFSIAQSQESGRLQVDGVWYDWTGGFDLKGSAFPPGREFDDIMVSLGSNWMAPQEWRDKTQAPPSQIPLELLPGKHTIRFAPEIRDLTVKPKPQNIYVPSNPVEIRTTE